MRDTEQETADDIELTGENNPDELDITDIEQGASDKIKKIQKKLHDAEEEKRQALEELQRSKADFLNAKKRLEEQSERDKNRQVSNFIERLLPLYDSFTMAMGNTAVWEKADPAWRTGIEGVYKELIAIFSGYNVTVVHPQGAPFDPNEHEAVDSEVVTDASQNDMVTAVLQDGIVRTLGDQKDVIRPARVRVGTFQN